MRSLIVGLLAVSLVGCTPTGGSAPPSSPASSGGSPSSVSAVPSPSPTPSESWDADQAAAVAAVQGYYQVSDELGANPSKFTKSEMTEKLGKYVGGELLPPNVAYFLDLAKHGQREEGQATVKWIKAGKAVDNHSARGRQVFVTTCQDLSGFKVVDSSGAPVPELNKRDTELPIRQFSVRKPKGQTVWRVYGADTVTGDCQ